MCGTVEGNLRVGDINLAMPAGIAVAAMLFSHRAWKAFAIWIALFLLATAFVATTKVLFIACGTNIDTVTFNAASGHAMLTAAAYPALLFTSLRTQSLAICMGGLVAGVLMGIGMGVFLVTHQYHSVSEVVIGWLVGTCASAWTVWILRHEPPQRISVAAMSCGVAAFLAAWMARPVELEIWAKQVGYTVLKRATLCGPAAQLPWTTKCV